MHYAVSRKVVSSIPDVIGFSNLPAPSRRTTALGLTQYLSEMSNKNLPEEGGKAWPVRKTENLAVTCEPTV
jgi:hypothetical protein